MTEPTEPFKLVPPPSGEFIRWKDTPEEEITRQSLRTRPDDFVRVPVPRHSELRNYFFDLSPRLASSFVVRENGALRLASPTVLTRLQEKITAFANSINRSNYIRPLHNRDGVIITIGENVIYTIQITDTRLNIQLRPEGIRRFDEISYGEGEWARVPSDIEAIKRLVADVALAEARKKFVKEKVSTRVGQAIGMNDPLAAKKEIGSFLGGRRRKTRKSKKTSKKTLRQSNGRRR